MFLFSSLSRIIYDRRIYPRPTVCIDHTILKRFALSNVPFIIYLVFPSLSYHDYSCLDSIRSSWYQVTEPGEWYPHGTTNGDLSTSLGLHIAWCLLEKWHGVGYTWYEIWLLRKNSPQKYAQSPFSYFLYFCVLLFLDTRQFYQILKYVRQCGYACNWPVALA